MTVAKAHQKPFVCDECGRRMTEKQAVRAMKSGCPAGCSGLDVHEVIETEAGQ